MKTGLTLEQLAAEITRQQSAKEDYVVNTGNLRLESYGPDLTLRVLDSDGADRIEPLEIGDIAHRQIGTHHTERKPVVSEKQVSYNVDMAKSFYFWRYL